MFHRNHIKFREVHQMFHPNHRASIAVLWLAALALILSACATPATPAPDGNAPAGTLVVYSGRNEKLIQPVLDLFKARYPNVDIVLKSGGNSELANALLEEQNNPQADVFITTEVLTVQKLYSEGIFEPYVSPNAAPVPIEFKQADGGWTGLTLRARVIMYNSDLLTAEEAPTSVYDLIDPQWKGQVAAAGSSNGSMQAQIAVMRQLAGDEAVGAWLTGLIANETTFFGGHTDVRKAVGAGEFKIGLVNHYYYYLQRAEGSPVGIIFPDQQEGQQGLIVNASAVGVVRGGKNPAAAKALVDFLLSNAGQEEFAELNYEYPIIPGVPLHPEVESITNFRLASANLVEASSELESTFDLIEQVGLP